MKLWVETILQTYGVKELAGRKILRDEIRRARSYNEFMADVGNEISLLYKLQYVTNISIYQE